LFGCGDRI